MMPPSSTSGGPPPPNPLLNAYEDFTRTTPLVTRYLLHIIVISYIISWFISLEHSLGCIPRFTLFQFEIYRIITSPFICNQLISLIFAGLSLSDNAKRLEQSLGSTNFVWLLLTIGVLTNLTFLGVCMTFYYSSSTSSSLSSTEENINNMEWLIRNSYGIWIILFGLITIECSKAPEGLERRIFFFTVPTKYYPIALCAFFSLLSGTFTISYVISICLGYLYGYDKLDFTKLSSTTSKRLEDSSLLSSLRSRPGFVLGQESLGSSAWSQEQQQQQSQSLLGGSSGFASLFQQQQQQTDRNSTNTSSGGSFFGTPLGGSGNNDNLLSSSNTNKPAVSLHGRGFPNSSGRTLGGGSQSSLSPTRQRPSSEARAAMLEAAQRRSQLQQQQPQPQQNQDERQIV